MGLFQPKNFKKFSKTALSTLIFWAVVANLLNPTVVNAKNESSAVYFANSSQITVETTVKIATDTDSGAQIGTTTIKSVVEELNDLESIVIKPNKRVKAVITAYTSTVDQCDDDPFVAASGKRVYDGMVAANWLPFGTKIKIPALYGDKEFTVDDRMNARHGYGRMDIWLDTTKTEAKKFGVKRVDVEIYYVKKADKKIVKTKPSQELAMKTE